jgi:hypothetical protein
MKSVQEAFKIKQKKNREFDGNEERIQHKAYSNRIC